MPNTASSVALSDEDPQTNSLMLDGAPWGLEKIYDYEAGGHHPVHLQDVLDNRYRVIHKLGSGGYANVWLCRDLRPGVSVYVAVKILMADSSTHDCPDARIPKLLRSRCYGEQAKTYFSLSLDQFDISGPNGTHLAFVYPLLGPRVSRLVHIANLDDTGPALRKICFDTAQALATLHAHGICHGDFRPANILTLVFGLDDLTEEELLKLVGEPKTSAVVIDLDSGKGHDLETAPKYLVYPVNWDRASEKRAESRLKIESACVIDFGESFEMSHPPTEVGMPQAYCSPEQVLENTIGRASDLWALGCTLFEIRTGRKLFDTFDDDVEECLDAIVTIMGRFPEPWWSETWERRRDFFEDSADANGRPIEVRERRADTSGQVPDGRKEETSAVNFERARPRSLEETIAQGFVYSREASLETICKGISNEETGVFADLLTKLLRYDADQRISASEVFQHEWFKFGI